MSKTTADQYDKLVNVHVNRRNTYQTGNAMLPILNKQTAKRALYPMLDEKRVKQFSAFMGFEPFH